jgi:hypothetical protein
MGAGTRARGHVLVRIELGWSSAWDRRWRLGFAGVG